MSHDYANSGSGNGFQRRGATVDDLRAEFGNPTWEPNAAAAATLPEIIVNGRQLREVSADVVAALATGNDPPELYVRGGQPSRIRVDEKGNHTIAPHNEASFRARLGRTADFHKANRDGKLTAVPPPAEVVRDVLSLDLNRFTAERGLPSFPGLDAVTQTPVLRPDGSILDRPGYDPTTRLYYAPVDGVNVPPVPLAPSREDVAGAVDLIEEAIGEFPYEGDADKANALATILSPYVRQAIEGKAPLAIIDAPQAGTGKSLLAECVGTSATGDAPAMMGAPAEDAEFRKQITATLQDGPTVIIIDNVDSLLSSPSLARALTAPVWSDRVLGTSQQVKLLQLATWIATGNNITVGGDLARRCYRVRLDAKQARPWRGRTFRHPDLIGWVRQNRGRLIGALLTLCRAWYAAGKPAGPSPIIGGFETWSRTVGGILHVAGVPGFLANLESLYDGADEENAQWERLLRGWRATWGDSPVTVNALADHVSSAAGSGLREVLPDTLLAFIDVVTPRYMEGETARIKEIGRFKIRLGKALKQRLGRRYGDEGLHLYRDEDAHAKVASWTVRVAGSAGNAGSVLSQHPKELDLESTHVLAITTPALHALPAQDDYDQAERYAITEGGM